MADGYEYSGFGFDGKKPVPCSDRAMVISVALANLIKAQADYEEAKRNVPEYTGQWSDMDYYAEELEALHRAADNYEKVLFGHNA